MSFSCDMSLDLGFFLLSTILKSGSIQHYSYSILTDRGALQTAMIFLWLAILWHVG